MTDRTGAGLFVLRISAGLIFFLHGWAKLFGEQISFVQEMLRMVDLSVPEAVLWGVATLEFVGGLALLLGLFTRSAAWVLTVEMVLVVAMFHVRQGFFIVSIPNAPLAYGFEYHVALVGSLVCLALGGPGSFGLRAGSTRGPSGEARIETAS